jgi:hypothetical protein
MPDDRFRPFAEVRLTVLGDGIETTRTLGYVSFKPTRLPKTLGRASFGGLNEGEPHVPAFRTDRSSSGHPSKRNIRRGETNNENDTHSAVGGRSCGRARAREFGDVCCWADDRARGACNDFGRECGGERGEDGCCRAQTRRSPQTCCPQTCCGAQALRALTGFVAWIFAARRRTAVRPMGTFSTRAAYPRGFGYRDDFRPLGTRSKFALT